MKRATYFSIFICSAITIIPAYEASASETKVKHTTLTASQKRILTHKKFITFQTQKNLRTVRNTGGDRMLNPQPLPPGPPPDAYKTTKLKSTYFNRGSAVSLNPQPLPPGPPPDKLNSSFKSRGSAVSLNPQPLPPGPPPDKLNTSFKSRGSAVSLNPQPLPPGPPPDKLNPAVNRINSTDRLQNLQLDRRTTGVR